MDSDSDREARGRGSSPASRRLGEELPAADQVSLSRPCFTPAQQWRHRRPAASDGARVPRQPDEVARRDEWMRYKRLCPAQAVVRSIAAASSPELVGSSALKCRESAAATTPMCRRWSALPRRNPTTTFFCERRQRAVRCPRRCACSRAAACRGGTVEPRRRRRQAAPSCAAGWRQVDWPVGVPAPHRFDGGELRALEEEDGRRTRERGVREAAGRRGAAALPAFSCCASAHADARADRGSTPAG